MSKKVLYDTLECAKLLEKEGVKNAEGISKVMASVFSHNLYSKSETNIMNNRLLAKLDRRMDRFERRIDQIEHSFEKAIDRVESRFENTMSHQFTKTITVLGSLVILVGAISTFIIHLN